MSTLDYITPIAVGVLVFAVGAVVAHLVLTLTCSRRCRPTTYVTLRNDAGAQMSVQVDPSNNESVDRFFNAIEQFQDEPRERNPSRRPQTLTIG